jgi:hypothetical protein
MNWNRGIRQTHRWLSITFTLLAIANIVALVQGWQATWLGLAALVPLVPLLCTGLYMFALPYVGRARQKA